MSALEFHEFQYEVKHNLPARDLSTNLRSRLESSLKERYENTCFQETYIKNGSVSILKKSIGHMKGSHFLGEITYNVLFKCLAYKPVRGSQIQAQVISNNESGVLCRSFPVEVPMQILMIKNHHADILDSFTNLRTNSVVQVQILDYNILYNSIYAVGRLISEVYQPMTMRKFSIVKATDYKITPEMNIVLKKAAEPTWLSNPLKELRNELLDTIKKLGTSDYSWQAVRSLTNPYELIAPDSAYLNTFPKLLPTGSIMTFDPPAISSDYYTLYELFYEFGLAGDLDRLKILVIGGVVASSKETNKSKASKAEVLETSAKTKEPTTELPETTKAKEPPVTNTGVFDEESSEKDSSASNTPSQKTNPSQKTPSGLVPIGAGDPRGLLQALIDFRHTNPSQIYSLGQAEWIKSFTSKYWNSRKNENTQLELEMVEYPDLAEIDVDYIFDELIPAVQSNLEIIADQSSRENNGLDLIIAGIRPELTYHTEGQDLEDYWGNEFRYQQIWLTEVFISIGLQKYNGTLVLAIGDIFSHLSGEILALITQYYKKVIIYKPKTTQPSDSQRYIVASQYKGVDKPQEILELGKKVLQTWESNLKFEDTNQSWEKSREFVTSVFNFNLDTDSTFSDSLTASVTNLVQNQISVLDTILDSSQQSINLNADLLQSAQKQKAQEWCNSYGLKGKYNIDLINEPVQKDRTILATPPKAKPRETQDDGDTDTQAETCEKISLDSETKEKPKTEVKAQPKTKTKSKDEDLEQCEKISLEKPKTEPMTKSKSKIKVPKLTIAGKSNSENTNDKDKVSESANDKDKVGEIANDKDKVGEIANDKDKVSESVGDNDESDSEISGELIENAPSSSSTEKTSQILKPPPPLKLKQQK